MIVCNKNVPSATISFTKETFFPEEIEKTEHKNVIPVIIYDTQNSLIEHIYLISYVYDCT